MKVQGLRSAPKLENRCPGVGGGQTAEAPEGQESECNKLRPWGIAEQGRS